MMLAEQYMQYMQGSMGVSNLTKTIPHIGLSARCAVL